jgi:hypothetical protein
MQALSDDAQQPAAVVDISSGTSSKCSNAFLQSTISIYAALALPLAY